MSKRKRHKEFGTAVIEENGSYVGRVVITNISHRKPLKEKDGFATPEAAANWADRKLAEYLEGRQARAQQKIDARRYGSKTGLSKEKWLEGQSFKSLAEAIQSKHPYADAAARELKDRADLLHDEIAFRALKDGANETEAFRSAKEAVGPRRERMERALSGALDALHVGMHAAAVARAKAILAVGLAMRGEPVPEDCELPAASCH